MSFSMYLVDHHLSISLCTALVFHVILYLRILCMIALTRAMLNVAGKCAVLWEAMQSFLDQQHDGVGNVKYRKELRYRYI